MLVEFYKLFKANIKDLTTKKDNIDDINYSKIKKIIIGEFDIKTSNVLPIKIIKETEDIKKFILKLKQYKKVITTNYILTEYELRLYEENNGKEYKFRIGKNIIRQDIGATGFCLTWYYNKNYNLIDI